MGERGGVPLWRGKGFIFKVKRGVKKGGEAVKSFKKANKFREEKMVCLSLGGKKEASGVGWV